MLQLYGSGRSRWVRPLWMLRELDVPFDEMVVDRDGGQLATPEFRALNPTGKIPVLIDDGKPIWESNAILLYLGDKYAERGLLPRAGSIERGVHDQWLFFLATEVEPPIWLLHKQRTRGEGGEEVARLAKHNFARAAEALTRRLADNPYLTGPTFSPADIVLGHLLTWQVMNELDVDPALVRYRTRLTSRRAFPKHLYR